MRVSHALIGAGAMLSGPATAAAAAAPSSKLVTSCPENSKLCYSVSVPSSSASSGKGEIFMQIQAPSSYEWASLGQGFQMAGSNIFIIYADAANNNVTLSPRLGTGETTPPPSTAAQIELLAGSGISNGLMTANLRCANCATWSGGNMAFNDAASSWIWAYKIGAAVASDSASAVIPVHDSMGTLELDLTKAAGGSDSANPFVTSDSSGSGGSGSGNGSGGSGGTTPVAGTTTTPGAVSSASSSGGSQTVTATAAHGIIMALTMLVLFPVGALMRRVFPRIGIWAHAAVQSVALVLTIAAAGLGISVGLADGKIGSAHARLGIAVTVLFAVQPIWGLLQHARFRRDGKRGAFGWAHRVLGGGAILLGVVNGGVGLQLADTVGESGGSAYVLTAGVLGCVYAAIFLATAFGKRATGAYGDVKVAKARGWDGVGEGGEGKGSRARRYDGSI